MNNKKRENFFPTVETIAVGDRVTAHGDRQIPFPSVATIVAKHPSGSGNYQVRFRLEGSNEEVIMFLGGEHPVSVEPPF